jgi:hypothetical protein
VIPIEKDRPANALTFAGRSYLFRRRHGAALWFDVHIPQGGHQIMLHDAVGDR